MAAVTEIDTTIASPVPKFYAHPRSLEEVVDHIARQAINLLDVDVDLDISVSEWEG